MSSKLLLLHLMLLLFVSCEKNDNADGDHLANTRSDSLNTKPDADIYIEVDTILNEYDVDLIIKRR